MNATKARAHADALRVKALALYAEAKALRDSPPSWRGDEHRKLIAKLEDAKSADDEYNEADVIAMRLEAEERRRGREA
jgi:hypothetical protein